MSKWATSDPELLELYQEAVQHIARYGKRMAILSERAEANSNNNLCEFARAEAARTVQLLHDLEKVTMSDYADYALHVDGHPSK